MSEHKALSAFEQAALQEEVEELRQKLAERDARLAEETKQHECWVFNAHALQRGYNELDKRHREEVEALNLRVARLVDTLHKLACLGNGDNYGNSIGNTMAQDALSAEADQRWLLDKQAELLELTEAAIAAPRCFFMGLEQGRKNLESMREHLDRCRDDYSCWPTWAKEGTGRITESGKAILVFAMMAYELRKQGETK